MTDEPSKPRPRTSTELIAATHALGDALDDGTITEVEYDARMLGVLLAEAATFNDLDVVFLLGDLVDRRKRQEKWARRDARDAKKREREAKRTAREAS